MLLGLVSAASKHPTAVVLAPTLLEEGLVPSVEVVFVEVKTCDDVERLIIEGHIDASNQGAFVKVIPDGWSVIDDTWASRETSIESVLLRHMVSYHSVMNRFKDPMAACVGLARAARLQS